MEGVVDHHMRAILTGIGGFQHCVTEFVRVTDRPIPSRVFHRNCPELLTGGQTPSGTPVTVQLLGGDENAMAENASKAISLGAKSIDINFGCPSKQVNRRAGGAVLLKEPDRVHGITASVRRAVPQHIPVSAKIRLGYETTDLALENAIAVQSANASFITVHARTKIDGYTHPARWEWLGRIKDELTIPMVANGDINSVEDFLQCRKISQCENYMLGRGAMCQPNLAAQIHSTLSQEPTTPINWMEVCQLVLNLVEAMQQQTLPPIPEKAILGRVKQWLAYLKRQYPEAKQMFNEVRLKRSLEETRIRLAQEQKSP